MNRKQTQRRNRRSNTDSPEPKSSLTLVVETSVAGFVILSILSCLVGLIAGQLGAISEKAVPYFIYPIVGLLILVVVALVSLLAVGSSRGLRSRWQSLRRPNRHPSPAMSWKLKTKTIHSPSADSLQVTLSRASWVFGSLLLALGLSLWAIPVASFLVSEDSVWYHRGHYILGPVAMLIIGGPWVIVGLCYLLQWRFVFDKDSGDLRAGDILFKHRFALSAVRCVEVVWGKGFFRGHYVNPRRSWTRIPLQCSTMECRIVMNGDDEEFRLSLWDHSIVDDNLTNAERLAEFLDVPICGNAYDEFRNDERSDPLP